MEGLLEKRNCFWWNTFNRTSTNNNNSLKKVTGWTISRYENQQPKMYFINVQNSCKIRSVVLKKCRHNTHVNMFQKLQARCICLYVKSGWVLWNARPLPTRYSARAQLATSTSAWERTSEMLLVCLPPCLLHINPMRNVPSAYEM